MGKQQEIKIDSFDDILLQAEKEVNEKKKVIAERKRQEQEQKAKAQELQKIKLSDELNAIKDTTQDNKTKRVG